MKLSERYSDADVTVRYKAKGVFIVSVVVMAGAAAALVMDLLGADWIFAGIEAALLLSMALSVRLLYEGKYRAASLVTLGVSCAAVAALAFMVKDPGAAKAYQAFLYCAPLPLLALAIGDRPAYPLGAGAFGLAACIAVTIFRLAPAAAARDEGMAEPFTIAAIFYGVLIAFSAYSASSWRSALLYMDATIRASKESIARISAASGSISSQREAGAAVERLYAETLAENAVIGGAVQESRCASSELDEDLRDILGSVQETAKLARDFSGLVDDQNAVAVESSAAVHEMSASLDSVSRLTTQKKDAADKLLDVAENGRAAAENLGQAFSSTVEDIGALLNVIQVVSDIAEHTNLLSMNAAIEAAHAGTAGKGFAVVASEIRSLAESSAENAATIAKDLGRIMDAVRATDSSVKDVDGSMKEIVAEIRRVSDAFQEILRSVDELAAGGRDIDQAMRSLSDTSIRVRDGSKNIENQQTEAEKKLAAAQNLSSSLAVKAGTIEQAAARVNAAMERLRNMIAKSNEEAEGVHEAIEALAAGVA